MPALPQPRPTSLPDGRTTAAARRLLAPNPSPMTLDGTNTWLLGAPADDGSPRPAIVVDPGPALEEHLDAITAAARIELVLITHRHRDHTEAIDALVERTGAPVRALLPEHSRDGAPLRDGERIEAAGVAVEVVATPGHTSDSVSFWLPDEGVLLSGDTVLGGSTTVIDHPDGTLGDYLATLDALERLGRERPTGILPGHGGEIADLAAETARLREHRMRRLEQVRAALDRLGRDAPVEAIVDDVYADAPARVRTWAAHSLAAQLAYLRG
ncbi:MAG: MBL fold metallo-hydrolase [Microbacteriaceae bacterium]|nr:MBL fold metallo-hydrolase [Microbacteriaceae bacterium]